jgi:hypothetical protein
VFLPFLSGWRFRPSYTTIEGGLVIFYTIMPVYVFFFPYLVNGVSLASRSHVNATKIMTID